MPFKCLEADLLPPAQLHAAFVAAFADYLAGPFQLSFDQWPAFLARQGISLGLSRVALRGEQLLAFALVAPRPDVARWRLGMMGAVPEARGQGAAPALLDELITRAQDQGVGAVELEVFAQNERAVRLYRSRGFEVLHALHGFEAVAPESLPLQAEPGVQVDLASAFAWLDEAALAIADLPLQVTPASLATVAAPLLAWRLGTAQLIVGEAGDGPVVVHCLLDRDRRQRDAKSLIEALLSRHPRRVIKVPALQRDDLGGAAMRDAGLQAQPLNQYLMLRRAG